MNTRPLGITALTAGLGVGLALVALDSTPPATAEDRQIVQAPPPPPPPPPAPAGATPAGNPDDYATQITPSFRHVNTAQDPKHTPKITAPDSVKAGEWFDVTVESGIEKRHPSYQDHHIHWIAIYKDDVELARAYLNPVHASPKVTFTIRLEDSCELRAMEEPNHTAPWASAKAISVTK